MYVHKNNNARKSRSNEGTMYENNIQVYNADKTYYI